MTLVPINNSHLKFWHRLHNNQETRKHQPVKPTTLDQQREMLERFADSDLDNTTLPSYKWAVFPDNQQEPVGIVSFHRTELGHGIGRIGYAILPEFWRNGYATAAVTDLVDLIFNQTDVKRLEAVCSIHNPASRTVLEKVGFTFEGIKYGYLVIREERVDHFSFGLLKSTWLQLNKK